MNNPTLDIEQAETLKCSKCESVFFEVSFVLKKISPIMSSTGEGGIMPMQIFRCADCKSPLNME